MNPRSLNRNFDSIHTFLSGLNHTFIVITLSETWYNEDDSNLIDIDDYVLLSAPRRGRRSGGSAIYVHNSVSYRVRDDLKLIVDPSVNIDHFESVFIEIFSSNSVNKNIILGNIYRAHRTDTNVFHTDLEHCLAKISNENKKCYISGDFNFDLLLHSTNTTINDFLNIFHNHSMYPFIDRPTRITPTSASLN